MIPPNASGAAAGTAGAAAKATASDAGIARDRSGDSGFADLLARPAAAPATGPSNLPGTPEADTETGDGAADTPADPTLPDQLLALIAASPTTASAAGRATPAPVSASGAQPPSLAPPGALAPTVPGASMAPVAPAGTDPLLAPLPPAGTANGDADIAIAAAGMAAVPAASGTGNAEPVALADFAQALGLAATADTAATTATGTDTASAPDIGDRGSLLAPTTSAATPMRATAAAATNPVLALPTDPDAGFDDAFGARIGWLADQRIGRAEIRLNPEHLGAIDVRLQIDGTRVSAEFQSANADVRHALENSVGRLRELLGQQGLQLAQSNVGHGRDGEHGERSAATRGGNPPSDHDVHPVERPRPQIVHSRGLLDEYA